MNWVGGSKARVRAKRSKKRQQQFWEDRKDAASRTGHDRHSRQEASERPNHDPSGLSSDMHMFSLLANDALIGSGPRMDAAGRHVSPLVHQIDLKRASAAHLLQPKKRSAKRGRGPKSPHGKQPNLTSDDDRIARSKTDLRRQDTRPASFRKPSDNPPTSRHYLSGTPLLSVQEHPWRSQSQTTQLPRRLAATATADGSSLEGGYFTPHAATEDPFTFLQLSKPPEQAPVSSVNLYSSDVVLGSSPGSPKHFGDRTSNRQVNFGQPLSQGWQSALSRDQSALSRDQRRPDESAKFSGQQGPSRLSNSRSRAPSHRQVPDSIADNANDVPTRQSKHPAGEGQPFERPSTDTLRQPEQQPRLATRDRSGPSDRSARSTSDADRELLRNLFPAHGATDPSLRLGKSSSRATPSTGASPVPQLPDSAKYPGKSTTGDEAKNWLSFLRPSSLPVQAPVPTPVRDPSFSTSGEATAEQLPQGPGAKSREQPVGDREVVRTLGWRLRRILGLLTTTAVDCNLLTLAHAAVKPTVSTRWLQVDGWNADEVGTSAFLCDANRPWLSCSCINADAGTTICRYGGCGLSSGR